MGLMVYRGLPTPSAGGTLTTSSWSLRRWPWVFGLLNDERKKRLKGKKSNKRLSKRSFSLSTFLFLAAPSLSCHRARDRAAPLLESVLLAAARLAVAEMASRARRERCNRVIPAPFARSNVDEKKNRRFQSLSSSTTKHSPCSPASCPWAWALLCSRASACLRSGCPGRDGRPGRAWGTRQRP